MPRCRLPAMQVLSPTRAWLRREMLACQSLQSWPWQAQVTAHSQKALLVMM